MKCFLAAWKKILSLKPELTAEVIGPGFNDLQAELCTYSFCL